ncbi:MAG: diacylglycerol kinase [Epsilonproteobacteria bacterium]|nr:diacylglycerol kinase [Campylobacterota bacterium]
MRRQPKYNFFKNSSYALSGLVDIFKSETSFKIEVFLLVPVLFLIWYLDVDGLKKILLFCSYFTVLIAEAVNSAIERVVDLVTLEYHEMAKKAKDAGSAIVFLSISQAVAVWIYILVQNI